MSKSMLIIETPISCRKCHIFNDKDYTCCGGKVQFKDIDKVQDWCPLKPVPQKYKYDVEKFPTVDYENGITVGHTLNEGWNACIDEIIGEEE